MLVCFGGYGIFYSILFYSINVMYIYRYTIYIPKSYICMIFVLYVGCTTIAVDISDNHFFFLWFGGD